MSYRLAHDALNAPNCNGVAKLVLIALADHANENTGKSDLSQGVIAKIVGHSRKAVSTALNKLERMGYVQRSLKKALSIVYRLTLPKAALQAEPGIPDVKFLDKEATLSYFSLLTDKAREYVDKLDINTMTAVLHVYPSGGNDNGTLIDPKIAEHCRNLIVIEVESEKVPIQQERPMFLPLIGTIGEDGKKHYKPVRNPWAK